VVWVIGIVVFLIFVALYLAIQPRPPVKGNQRDILWPKDKDQRCVECGQETIYEFCGRPMCPTCKGHIVGRVK
jgi:hypothetical protein